MFTRCTECDAVQIDGILTHRKGCTGYSMNNPDNMNYVRPPAIEMKFDSPEEQAEFMRNLSGGSANTTPVESKPTAPSDNKASNAERDDDTDVLISLFNRYEVIHPKASISRNTAKKMLIRDVQAWHNTKLETATREARISEHHITADMFVYENASITYARLKRRAKQLNKQLNAIEGKE